jgi:hypothetical protein
MELLPDDVVVGVFAVPLMTALASWLGGSGMWKLAAALSLAAMLISGSVAVAQMKEKAPVKPRSAASIECSKQADAKGLHGKVRKKFRSKCMRDMKKA